MQQQTDYKFERINNLFFLILTIVIFAGITILTIFELPPVVYVSALQAVMLDGEYYPILTIFFVFIPAFIPLVLIKSLTIFLFNLFFVEHGAPKVPYFYKLRW